MRLDDNLRTDRFLHAELARLVEGMGLSGALLEQQQAHLHGAIVLLVTRVPIGGESTHPQRDLPWAVFGAFLVCTVIYIAVQDASHDASFSDELAEVLDVISGRPTAGLGRLSEQCVLFHGRTRENRLLS